MYILGESAYDRKVPRELVAQLDWEERPSLGLFLSFQLRSVLNIGESDAAELAALLISKSDRTVREWRTKIWRVEVNYPIGSKDCCSSTGVCRTRNHSETFSK